MRSPIATPAIVLAAFLLAGCVSQPEPHRAPAAARSFDGLVPLEGTLMTQVWVREGFRLDGYQKVILENAGIRYRPLTGTQDDAAAGYAIGPEQKAELKRLINEEFDRALDRLTLPQVTEPGPDVLRVRGYLLDVVSRIPPDDAGVDRYHIESVGQATFVVELIDSQTDAVLVRALDTRSASTPGETYRSTRASNRAQVRRLIARWADLLVDALNDLTAIDQLKGA